MLPVGFPPPGCKWKMAGRKLEVHLNPEVDIRTVLLSLNLPQSVFTSSVHFFIVFGKQSLYMMLNHAHLRISWRIKKLHKQSQLVF